MIALRRPGRPRAGSLVAACLRLLWVAWLAMGVAWAQQLVPVPPLKAHVTDLSRVLAAADAQVLEERLSAFESARGSQIAILILPSTQPESIEAFSIRVAESWKLGRKGTDDGVLLVVATGDRRMRIEVGYGLEGAIPDAVAKQIVAERMAPRFKAGQFREGLEAALDAIEARISGEALPVPDFSGEQGRAGEDPLSALGGILVAALVGGMILRLILGRFLGSAVTAGLAGTGVTMVSGSLLLGAGLGLVLFVLLLAGVSFLGGLPGGGWSSGGGRMGGGGWSGGGGGGFGPAPPPPQW